MRLAAGGGNYIVSSVVGTERGFLRSFLKATRTRYRELGYVAQARAEPLRLP